MRYQCKESYLLIFKDCFITKGTVNVAVCDVTRNNVSVIPVSYYDLLEDFKAKRVSEIYESYDVHSHAHIDKFIDFILDNEYGTFVDCLVAFPEIKKQWYAPEKIDNAIVDVDEIKFDFEAIINELDLLDCKFLQIRSFTNLYSLEEFSSLLCLAIDTSIEGIEIITKYNSIYKDQDYIDFFEGHILLASLHLHSAPINKAIDVNFGYKGDSQQIASSIKKKVHFLEEEITGPHSCGRVSKSYFCVNSVETLIHNSLFNSCLNRKISIDSEGNIKNCPSMAISYGNIKDSTLQEALCQTEFKRVWKINKDAIKVCQDCEFRYICTDCRAYLEDPNDESSKPLKCGYDPYTGQWEEWSTNPLKQKAIEYYETLTK
jgi:SPASM domain peptide maturase of grasp-with-spasm system